MRLLFVNDTPRNGGPGRSLYTILKHLPRPQVHRTVVLPREGVISELYRSQGVAEEIVTLPEIVENPIEPWHRAMAREDYDAPLPLRLVRGLGNVGRGAAGMLKLARLAKRGRYDLLYCNGTNANFFGGVAAKLSGVPALWHVRYTSLPKALVPLHEKLAESDDVAAIVCVSEASAALFSSPKARAKLKVVHNALDIEEFDRARPVLRAELQLPEGAVVFGSQGRILPRKGYLEMIEAAHKALAQLADAERALCHFVVLGDTPEDLRPDHLAECRARVAELGLAPHVHFLGFRGNVPDYVCDYDVGVVPSTYPDPLPRAVIECMAQRLPVLAFDVGGVGEMLGGYDSKVGRLLRGAPADVEGLAQAFVDYFRDPALRATQGQAARARIEAHYDAKAHSRAIFALIEQALGARVA